MCKPGYVVTGLLVHTGTNKDLFVDVSIHCGKLGASGAITTTETLRVAGSLTNTLNPVDVQCGAGEAIARLGTWTGSGFDGADLSCSTPVCR
jgi:hypothetical protein